MGKRVVVIVLDSFGIGEEPDAAAWGDEGSNTLCACATSPHFRIPNLTKLGLLQHRGRARVRVRPSAEAHRLSHWRLCAPAGGSQGKDSTVGHWEMAGVISPRPLPTYPQGFPPEVIEPFEEATGRKVICNLPYSGTDVIRDYGREQVETGALIVYTSADSVFQIAAHESVVPPEQLYEYCRIAREQLQGKHGVGRVIARPFEGEWPYQRTKRRHDFSLEPTGTTMLDRLKEEGFDVLSVGKIFDLFAGRGTTDHILTSNNPDGIDKTIAWMDRDFHGLCYTNLVDTDMIYGHRNDVDGYAKAISYFDAKLPEMLAKLRDDDLLMITADHGCDPVTPSTDHSREYVPWLVTGPRVRQGADLGTLPTFADLGATMLDYLGATPLGVGTSRLAQILPGKRDTTMPRHHAPSGKEERTMPTPHNAAQQGQNRQDRPHAGRPPARQVRGRALPRGRHLLQPGAQHVWLHGHLPGQAHLGDGQRHGHTLHRHLLLRALPLLRRRGHHPHRLGGRPRAAGQLRDIVIGQGACTDSNFAASTSCPGTIAPIATSACCARRSRRPRRVALAITWATCSPPTSSTATAPAARRGPRWACSASRWRPPRSTSTPSPRASARSAS